MGKTSRDACDFSGDRASPLGGKSPDVETHIQEDLTGEIDALTAAIFELLKRRRDVGDAEITEDMVQRLREVIFFAAMNGAHDILEMAGDARGE
jgi:hypothetical protein